MSGESDRGKLGNFLREVIDWQWDVFCEAEKSPEYSGYQSSVFSLVRASSDGKLSAIKLAIARIDGNVETPIKVEYPKAYLLFPYAEKLALPPAGAAETALLADPYPLEEPPEATEKTEQSLATLTLRETLNKMADESRVLPMLIHEQKKKVEHGENLEGENIPLVKSVIAANLLILANDKHSFEAITEIFNQIDGKLVEVIKLLGDIYMTSYALEAPYNATKNKDGIWQIEQPIISNVWAEKLDRKR